MNKLYKFLDNNGVNYSRDFFGDSYFDCTFKIPVIFVNYSYLDITFNEYNAIYKKVKKYCNRYGYIIKKSASFGYGFYIVKSTDYITYNKYYELRDYCVSLWENTYHNLKDSKATENIFTPFFNTCKNEVLTLLGGYYMQYYLITSDFFSDWELVTAPNKSAVDNYILSSGKIDNDITVVCSSEDMAFRDDLSEYDYTIVYLSDYDI